MVTAKREITQGKTLAPQGQAGGKLFACFFFFIIIASARARVCVGGEQGKENGKETMGGKKEGREERRERKKEGRRKET